MNPNPFDDLNNPNKRLDLADIERMTGAWGEGWALAHVRRLLKLIDGIGAGLEWNREALQWAVYLHDWGAYPRFAQAGVDHALRSRQVAEEQILPQTDLASAAQELILTAIELHDYRDQRPVPTHEALLLREADYLDFLGATGVARGFAAGGKDLPKSIALIQARKNYVKDRISLPLAREMAKERLVRMEAFLQALQVESYGYL